MAPVQTEWADSTAAAHQGLTGRDVKQVSLNPNHYHLINISS